MNRVTKVTVLCLILLVGLLTVACPKRVSIGDIEANPGKYQNKEVAVAGIVKNSYGVSIPLVNESGGIYKVDDGTGSNLGDY